MKATLKKGKGRGASGRAWRKKGDFLTENVTSVTFGVTFVIFNGILQSLKKTFSRSIILGQIPAFTVNVHGTLFQGPHSYPSSERYFQIILNFEIYKMQTFVRWKRKMDHGLWNTSARTKLPGLPIRDYAGGQNNCVPRRLKMSAIDVTAKEFFERLYLVPRLRQFALIVTMPSASTPPLLTRRLFLDFSSFFPRVTPQIFCQHDSPSNSGAASISFLVPARWWGWECYAQLCKRLSKFLFLAVTLRRKVVLGRARLKPRPSCSCASQARLFLHVVQIYVHKNMIKIMSLYLHINTFACMVSFLSFLRIVVTGDYHGEVIWVLWQGLWHIHLLQLYTFLLTCTLRVDIFTGTVAWVL